MTGAGHGTASRYGYHGCRCDVCRAGNAARCAAAAASRAERLAADPSAAPHGNAMTYKNWGCRCLECTAAWAGYLKACRGGLPLSHYLPEAAR